MKHCTGVQERAHGVMAHCCVGEEGHDGPHWCLLGHVWTDTENADRGNEKEAS